MNLYIIAAVRLACRTQQWDMVGGGEKKDLTADKRQLPFCNPRTGTCQLPANESTFFIMGGSFYTVRLEPLAKIRRGVEGNGDVGANFV